MNFEKQYSENIKYLLDKRPNFVPLLEKEDISNIILKQSTDGLDININIDGHDLYPQKTKFAIVSQVKDYMKNPKYTHYSPPYPPPPTPILNEIHLGYLNEIAKISPYIKEPTPFLGYNQNLEVLTDFLVLGIGNGQYIETLMDEIDIKHLVIVDENIKMLKVSMHIINWVKIFEHFSQDGYSIEFLIASQAKPLAYSVLNHYYLNRQYATYLLYNYIHYESPFFTEFMEGYRDKRDQLFNGWGFYDDGLLSMNHTFDYMNKNIPIYKGGKKLPKNASVFIVASGPSVDNDIEYIKKQKDNIIICSCGSSLSILEAHNIVPDFHFEVERNKLVYDHLVNNISKEFLKKITFISLNVIYPLAKDLFKETYYFCRENDAGSSVIPSNIPALEHCNPTVTNGAISFIVNIGFENIYLFGIDMGHVTGGKHHSKDTPYYTKNTGYGGGDDIFIDKSNSNFGKCNIKTNLTLEWAKQRIENCLVYKNKTINVYNCSDGVYIKGTTPLMSDSISDIFNIEKNKIKKVFVDNFIHEKKDLTKFYKEVEKNYLNEKKELFKDIDLLILELSANIKSFSQLSDIQTKTYNIIKLSGYENRKDYTSLTAVLLRGTISHMYSSIYTHSLATKDKEEAIIFINNGFKIVIKFLKQVKADISIFTIE